tara:strand:+ start:158 stop:862 length:705 start_codon:yes stop_codon:yes gene_type:complete
LAQADQTLRITSAIASPTRAIAHVLRDEIRRPAEVIQFMRLPEGARVLDLYAADGYYSYLLAAAAGSGGRVFAQNPIATDNLEDVRQMYSLADALDERIAIAKLTTVTHVRSDFAALPIDSGSLDAILLAQILHDFANSTDAGAIALLQQLGTLLKPDGALIVIDHAGDANQDNERLHRMPIEEAKRIAQAAGFSLESESALLANLRDRRRRPVFDPMLARNTDRFLLRFVLSP